MARVWALDMSVCGFSRSGRLRPVTTSELSSDRCLPRLFLRRVPLLLWKRQRKGKSLQTFSLPALLCFSHVQKPRIGEWIAQRWNLDVCLWMQWVPEITHHCPKTPFLLVGTQIDLRDDPSTIEKLAKNKQKPITPETAEKLARDLKAVKYVECSALTQVTVTNTQTQVIRTLVTLRKWRREERLSPACSQSWPLFSHGFKPSLQVMVVWVMVEREAGHGGILSVLMLNPSDVISCVCHFPESLPPQWIFTTQPELQVWLSGFDYLQQ